MITFQCADLDRKVKKKKDLVLWLEKIARREGYSIEELNYIFCSDEYLYRMNVQYLNHSTYTDIITFDNGEGGKKLEGDIFISLDRVAENAATYSVSFDQELLRVLSHGLLHLCGYKDKTSTDASQMRKKENEALGLWKS
jgi:probable rRNA maturation factor